MLQVISNDDPIKWNKIVKSFKDHDVYYLAEYSKAFQIHGDGDPILFYFDNGKIRAINVVMKRDIALDTNFKNKIPIDTYFDIITPYGYGGWIIEGVKENYCDIFQSYEQYYSKNSIVCEFVRFHPILQNSMGLEASYNITDLGKTISIDLLSKEQIFADFTSKNRNMIRKALKNDVAIYWGRSPYLFEKFEQIYNATMDKDDATEYYYFDNDFYGSILNDLKHNCLIFYAIYENKIISMSLIIFANNKAHYHLSGSEKEYQHLAPTNLLLHEASIWALENGFQTLHLGGGLGGKEDSLFSFKKAFNREKVNKYYIGKKIFNNEAYRELTEIRKPESNFDPNSNFFPIYRQ
ncbi:MAG: GNAT family N-acetyltransferase [Bacilli bacterium]|nr:GNAT family N-acetyltransferase [Bacilli bacterium]